MERKVIGGQYAPRILHIQDKLIADSNILVFRIAADYNTPSPLSAEINNTHLMRETKTQLFTQDLTGLGYLDVPKFLIKEGDTITTNEPFFLYGITLPDNTRLKTRKVYIHGFTLTSTQPSDILTVPRGYIYHLYDVRLEEDGTGTLPGSFTLYVDGKPIITSPILAFNPHPFRNLTRIMLVKNSISIQSNGNFTDTIRGIFVVSYEKVD